MSWPKIVDFEGNSNPYQGVLHNPIPLNIVSGGHNGSSYAIGGAGTDDDNNKSWYLKDASYNWVSEVKAISFWHYAKQQINNNNGSIPQLLYIVDDANNPPDWSGKSYFGMDALSVGNEKYYISNSGRLFSKWYVDGVEVENNGVSGNQKVDTNYGGSVYTAAASRNNTWHHIYVEFDVPILYDFF